MLLWLVHRQRARTKSGELMIFLTGEDQTGNLECVMFPRTYSKYGHLLKGPGPYRITGTVEEEYGVVTINVQRIQKLSADITHPVSELGNG